MNPTQPSGEKEHLPRAWVRWSKDIQRVDSVCTWSRPGVAAKRPPQAGWLNVKYFEYLSLEEHEALLQSERVRVHRLVKRIEELEGRLTYLLDDPECELYQQQAREVLDNFRDKCK